MLLTLIYRHIISIPEGQILSRLAELHVNICSMIQETAKLFSKEAITFLYPHQQCMRLLAAPSPHQHLAVLIFLIVIILVGVRWYLIVMF